MGKKQTKCKICEEKIEGMGHNPQPLLNQLNEPYKVSDRCCDRCNSAYVIPSRIGLLGVRRVANDLQ